MTETEPAGMRRLRQNLEMAKASRETIADHPGIRLSPEDVRRIRRLHASGTSTRDLSADFGISKQAVRAVVNGTTWGHVDGGHP